MTGTLRFVNINSSIASLSLFTSHHFLQRSRKPKRYLPDAHIVIISNDMAEEVQPTNIELATVFGLAKVV